MYFLIRFSILDNLEDYCELTLHIFTANDNIFLPDTKHIFQFGF